MSTHRPVDLARLSLGVVALARPHVLVRLGAEDGQGVRTTIRILGARYVVQSAAGFVLVRPWVRDADAAIDLIHAATMLAMAALAPAHRRLALLSAATATAFAAADLNEKMR